LLRALGKRSLVLGVVASVVLHLVASVLLHTSVPRLPALPLPEPMELVEFDIHEAPAPPQAALAPEEEDEPDDQAEEPPPEPSAAPEEPEPTMAEILPEGVPALEEIAAADAGPPDAAAPDLARARGPPGLVSHGGRQSGRMGPEEAGVLVPRAGRGRGLHLVERACRVAESLADAGQIEPRPGKARPLRHQLLELLSGLLQLALAHQGLGQPPARRGGGPVALEHATVHALAHRCQQLAVLVDDLVHELALLVIQHGLGLDRAQQPPIQTTALLDVLARVLFQAPHPPLLVHEQVVASDLADAVPHPIGRALARRARRRHQHDGLVEQLAPVEVAVQLGKGLGERGVQEQRRLAQPVDSRRKALQHLPHAIQRDISRVLVRMPASPHG
jgi:hypothetical protein